MELPEAKQIIAIRTDISMNVGKIVAQAAHASLGSILNLFDKNETKWSLDLDTNIELKSWLTNKFVKISIAIESEEELLHLHQTALDAGLNSVLIQDAGRTIFNNIPTYTCIAIGPHFKEKIDPVTKKYPLL